MRGVIEFVCLYMCVYVWIMQYHMALAKFVHTYTVNKTDAIEHYRCTRRLHDCVDF